MSFLKIFGAAAARGIFGAGSSFCVGLRAAGVGGGEGLISVFRVVFSWYWRGFRFGGGTGRLAIILWSLNSFLMFPNFLRTIVLG